MRLYLLIDFPIKSQNRQKSSYEVASENHRYTNITFSILGGNSHSLKYTQYPKKKRIRTFHKPPTFVFFRNWNIQ